MRFKNSPQLPGAGSTRAWLGHGSDTPTSPRAIYALKLANGGLFYTPLYVGLYFADAFSSTKKSAKQVLR